MFSGPASWVTNYHSLGLNQVNKRCASEQAAWQIPELFQATNFKQRVQITSGSALSGD